MQVPQTTPVNASAYRRRIGITLAIFLTLTLTWPKYKLQGRN